MCICFRHLRKMNDVFTSFRFETSIMLEIVWIFSTGLGTLLFLAEIAILCWVKFYNYSEPAAVAASVVLVPVCIVLVWLVVHFNRSLVQHKYEISFQRIKELQQITNQLYTDTGTALSSPAASPCPYHRV